MTNPSLMIVVQRYGDIAGGGAEPHARAVAQRLRPHFNVEIANDRLILRGQKKLEKQERGRDYYHAERRFGAFTRVIPLPSEVDVKKSSAKYKNGLLRVVLPKANHANGTQIEVRAT